MRHRIVLLIVLAALVTAAGPASAVNRYVIQPNSPKPAVCNNSGTVPAGTWLQNKPCGYFVGTAMAGSSYDVHETTPTNYHFGRSLGNNNLCAWIPPGALSSQPTGTAPASCGAATRDAMWHRRTFGYDFNAAAHQATDGSAITVSAGCPAYYNYFTTSGYSTGSFRDQAGTAGTTVAYRYTANGPAPRAMAVRDDRLGWVFVPRNCVTDWRGVVFHNDND